MANDPTKDGTSVDAPLEWLAFRGLPLFPSFPFRARIITTAVSGRGEEMEFILILSPNNAPPVFFLLGSTEITAIVLSV